MYQLNAQTFFWAAQLLQGGTEVAQRKDQAMIVVGLLALIVLIATPAAFSAPAAAIPDWCAVTLPNGIDPEHVEPPGHWVGQDGLFIGVPTDGISYAKTESDSGGGWNKFIVVREGRQGELSIVVTPTEGQDMTAPGIAEIAPSSIAGSIWFPAEGCYEITATTEVTTLTVTVWAVFVDDWLAVPPG